MDFIDNYMGYPVIQYPKKKEMNYGFKSNVTTAHPTAVELRGITIEINIL